MDPQFGVGDWRRRPLTQKVSIGVGALASLALAWLAVHGLDWGQVGKSFGAFPTWVILLALPPMLAAMFMRAVRWRVLLADYPVRWHQIFLTQNTGIGLNNLLPIRMISEPVQLVIIIRRYGIPGAIALATLMAGNVMDIFATALLMGLGVLIAPALQSLNIQMGGAIILFLVSMLVFVVAAKGLKVVPAAQRVRYLQQLVVALGLLRENPQRLLASFAATFTHWLLLGVTGWIIAWGMGIELNLISITALLVATTFFVSAVPSLPGGVGSYELAMTSTLRVLEVPHATAFAYALIMHLVIFLPPNIVAVTMLLRIGPGQIFHRSDPRPIERDGQAIAGASSAD